MLSRMLVVSALSLLCLVAIARGQQYSSGAFGNYRFYADTWCIDFDWSSASAVRNLNHCFELAQASPASNGFMFLASNSTCVVLTSFNNEIVVRVQSKPGYLTAVKDISNTYKTALKSDSAQGAASTTYNMINIVNNNGGTFTTVWNASVQSYNKSSSCKCTYRNILFSSWNNRTVQISLVRFRFWLNTMPVVEIVLNGTNSNGLSWWTPSRVISAIPYTSQRIYTANYCGNTSFAAEDRGFRTYTGACTSGCSYNAGFLGTTYTQVCNYEAPCGAFPCFFYSRSSKDTNYYTAGEELGYAEFFSIEVKVENRVVFV